MQGQGGKMFGPNVFNFFNAVQRWPKAGQYLVGRAEHQAQLWREAGSIFKQATAGQLE